MRHEKSPQGNSTWEAMSRRLREVDEWQQIEMSSVSCSRKWWAVRCKSHKIQTSHWLKFVIKSGFGQLYTSPCLVLHTIVMRRYEGSRNGFGAAVVHSEWEAAWPWETMLNESFRNCAIISLSAANDLLCLWILDVNLDFSPHSVDFWDFARNVEVIHCMPWYDLSFTIHSQAQDITSNSWPLISSMNALDQQQHQTHSHASGCHRKCSGATARHPLGQRALSGSPSTLPVPVNDNSTRWAVWT